MGKQILVTGGAGFIGSHLCEALLAAGHRVRALDSLTPQVHPSGRRPDYLDPEVELRVGDVRDPEAVRAALAGVEVVYHLAAAVGVGESMYELEKYVSTNSQGTAVLLEAAVRGGVQRLIVASSMSVYGEGLYREAEGGLHFGTERPLAQLQAGEWEVRDAQGQPLLPLPTPESKPPSLASVYALSKYDQERLCLLVGQAYHIPTVALRFFNVYGPRQALSNPYTGVLAIFSSRLLNGAPPLVYEDGHQRRDFVNVKDVAQALRLALHAEEAAGRVINVGSGRDVSILEVAERLARVLHRPEIEPQVTGKCRLGDIRHCFADISLARRVLGYAPAYTLEAGLQELAPWLERQTASDRVAEANAQLAARGLTV